MASQIAIVLAAGELRLELSPSVGGSIFAFEWIGAPGARPILRQCNSRSENVLDAACFPLVPYVNRIRDGRFAFRGREVRIAPNMAGDPNPLHGQGWLSTWRIDQVSERQAVLSFAHVAGEWPWDYRAAQSFELDENGLSLRLVCHNTGGDPMPCGLGQHPYFPCGPETKIATRVDHVWTVDRQVLPVARVPAQDGYDLWDREVCGRGLDNGFDGWTGVAQLTDSAWPFDLELRSPGTRFFQLYSPNEGGLFVAEPVTHANAALNAPEEEWGELGMRVLDPGGAMGLEMRLEVTPK